MAEKLAELRRKMSQVDDMKRVVKQLQKDIAISSIAAWMGTVQEELASVQQQLHDAKAHTEPQPSGPEVQASAFQARRLGVDPGPANAVPFGSRAVTCAIRRERKRNILPLLPFILPWLRVGGPAVLALPSVQCTGRPGPEGASGVGHAPSRWGCVRARLLECPGEWRFTVFSERTALCLRGSRPPLPSAAGHLFSLCLDTIAVSMSGSLCVWSRFCRVSVLTLFFVEGKTLACDCPWNYACEGNLLVGLAWSLRRVALTCAHPAATGRPRKPKFCSSRCVVAAAVASVLPNPVGAVIPYLHQDSVVSGLLVYFGSPTVASETSLKSPSRTAEPVTRSRPRRRKSKGATRCNPHSTRSLLIGNHLPAGRRTAKTSPRHTSPGVQQTGFTAGCRIRGVAHLRKVHGLSNYAL